MKLISQSKGQQGEAILTLLPQDKEDLFSIYNIINTDDEIIFKKIVKLKDETKGSKQQIMKLRIAVTSSDFIPETEFLRYKGATVDDEGENRANLEVPVGKYFAHTIDFQYPFTIIKKDFNAFTRKVLDEAVNVEKRSDMAAIALQEGIAHLCLLTNFGTILKLKIETSIPKKKRGTDILKYDDKIEKFYKQIYDGMKRHFDFDKLKCIIICSPGFWSKTCYDKIINFANNDNDKKLLAQKYKFLVAHSSTGYLQGIDEVLKDPAYAKQLSNTKNAQEVIVLDEFMKCLNDDDGKAWYGEAEIMKANELGAIDNLLITDTLLRADDVGARKKFLKLVAEVESTGGKVTVFSGLHDTGKEVDTLTGLACILKYPVPDLDEDEE